MSLRRRDIRIMQEADVIIANGRAMEHWVDQVVDSFDREDRRWSL